MTEEKFCENGVCSPKRGVFAVKIYKKGELVEEYEDHNVIVNDARTAMARLIGEGDQSCVVTQICIGEGTEEAAVTDEHIYQPVLTKKLESFSYPEVNQVEFKFLIDVSEANGANITEFGLITAGGSLFARKVRGAIAKDEDIAISGTWTIIF